MPSDLRESQAIRNDADVILFIYRPEYYFSYGEHPNAKYSPNNITQSEYEMISELIIAKNRFGDVGVTVFENFIGAYSRFTPAQEDTQDNFLGDTTYETPPDLEDNMNIPPF